MRIPCVYIDADACPVKDETYRVAQRYGLSVILVANSWMTTPDEDWVKLIVVENTIDGADDWIVDHIQENDVLVTTDIPLVSRSLKKGAKVLSPKGKIYNESNITDSLATRNLLTDLRDSGIISGGGPPPFSNKDRSLFLQKLDQLLQVYKQ